MKTRIIIYLAVISLALFGGAEIAGAAVVTGVTGTMSNGSSITITGSGFGSNGPNILVFDNFEGGVNGNPIRTGAGSATVGQWDVNQRSSDSNTIYSNAAAVSGSLSFRADQLDADQPTIIRFLPSNTRDLFMSLWVYIPAGDNLPGEGTADRTNWKIIWAMNGDSTVLNDNMVPVYFGNSSGYITGNDTAYGRWFNFDLVKGQWLRYWFWIKARSDTTGAVHFWELDRSAGVIQKANDNNVQVFTNAGGQYERVNVNGYGRTTPNSHPTFDDVYLAVGDNARARVEIGNSSTYNNSTNLAIATVTSWNDTSIIATVRQGSFTSGQQAYLFVFDSNGVVNASGYPITVGGTPAPDTTPPSAPTGLVVN